jgi:hypothetical protein
MRQGNGEKPPNEPVTAPVLRWRCTDHQHQGSRMTLAPMMRAQVISNGSSSCRAEARAMTIKADQIDTVTTAASQPVWREEPLSSCFMKDCILGLSVLV